MTLVKLHDTKLIHKHLTSLYTNNKRSEREIKETISFTTVTKGVKYQGRNIPKEAKYLYAENSKTVMKEIKGDRNRWKE